jgi:hypothetical protein
MILDVKFISYDPHHWDRRVKNHHGWTFKIWRLTIQHFDCICGHHPEAARVRDGFIANRIDMTVNGPYCRTKRWWIYLENHSYMIDCN